MAAGEIFVLCVMSAPCAPTASAKRPELHLGIKPVDADHPAERVVHFVRVLSLAHMGGIEPIMDERGHHAGNGHWMSTDAPKRTRDARPVEDESRLDGGFKNAPIV